LLEEVLLFPALPFDLLAAFAAIFFDALFEDSIFFLADFDVAASSMKIRSQPETNFLDAPV